MRQPVTVAFLALLVTGLAILEARTSPVRFSGAPTQSSDHRVTSGYVPVPGGRLWYEEAGSGEVLVLVHGNAGDRRHWDHQFPALAEHFRVVRYDVRGYGMSSVPDEAEPYADHEDLVRLLDHLRVEKAHIAGWSMGAGIALDFVIAHPDRALSLISVGPWVNGHSSPAVKALFADLAPLSTTLATKGPTAAVDAWMAAPFFASGIRNAKAGEEFRRIAAAYSWWAFSHRSPQRRLAPPARERLSEVRVPTLVMTAEHDIPACLEAADLLGRVQGSRKVVMEGTGHLLHMEKPAEFNRHVSTFLTANSANPKQTPKPPTS